VVLSDVSFENGIIPNGLKLCSKKIEFSNIVILKEDFNDSEIKKHKVTP
jgi:hypothetical protein